jgi:hypothetical protein
MYKSRKMRWGRYVACTGKRRHSDIILSGKPEGKKHIGRPRRKWDCNEQVDLTEMCVGGLI